VSSSLPQIVPAPVSVRAGAGPAVLLADRLAIAAPAELWVEARWFRNVLEAGTGWRIDIVRPGEPAAVVLELAARGQLTASPGPAHTVGAGPGGYRVVVGDGRVSVSGEEQAGVFYGLQTLRQLLPDATLRRAPVGRGAGQGVARPVASPVPVDPVVVEDGPRFGWRGVHLDVCRHFFPKSFLLELVDLAAFHKLNSFHLHLTDDQGWRFPVEAHPRLVEVGAWRRRSQAGHKRENRFDDQPHGGYYTKDDLREVVAYAAERHVNVVPEVEMPGHTVAAIAAYPELGNTGAQLEVGDGWGIYSEVVNLDQGTVGFFGDVIDEVCDVFPGPYLHIGGDECPTSEWENSPRARALMESEGFTSARQLQGWFTARIAPYVARHGRRLVGWDEILEGGAPPGAVVMSWRGVKGGVEAASLGHDVVMVPEEWLYFDWAYSDDPAEPLAIRGATPVERVYRFDPVPPGIPDDRVHHVLGAQCQLWTEYVKTPAHAEYLYFPRLCAFAETVWSPPPPADGGRHFAEFEPRLARHLRRLGALGVNYRPLEGPTPGQARTWRSTSGAANEPSLESGA